MKIIITENGGRRYYYKAGDMIKHIPTDEIFTVKEVNVKEGFISVKENELIEIKLSTDVRPTKETIKNAKIEDRRGLDGDDMRIVGGTIHLGVSDKVVLFAKLKDNVKIPCKDEENGGWDIYANFEEDYMVIPPHSTVMIPTKLLSAFSSKYVFILKERGSTGTKGMGQRAGVIDSGYRGEWLVPITNENPYTIIIAKKDKINRTMEMDAVIYPYEKAICQAILVEVPKVKVVEISEEELKAIPSKRADGKLGSSGK